jgi:hypothetical protein
MGVSLIHEPAIRACRIVIPAAVLSRLATLGLDARLAEVLAEMLRAVEEATIAEAKAAAEAILRESRDKNADRQARFRERNRIPDVTKITLHNVSNVTKCDENPSRAPAFFIGEEEEVVVPLEDATHPIPKGKKRSDRATRVPSDWKPDSEMLNYASCRGMTQAEIDRMGEDLVSWSLSSPKGKSLNWRQTWQVWVRRFVENNPRQKPINGSHGGVGAALRNIQLEALKREAAERQQMLDLGSGSNGGAFNLLLPKR